MTRKYATEKLKSLWYFLTNNDYPQKDLDALKVAIKALEQEPKTGHWITCNVLQEVKCSECRMCFRHTTSYCPNCGAKMESEVNE